MNIQSVVTGAVVNIQSVVTATFVNTQSVVFGAVCDMIKSAPFLYVFRQGVEVSGPPCPSG